MSTSIKVEASSSEEIEFLKRALSREREISIGYLENAAGDCGACAEGVACGSVNTAIEHSEKCVYSELKRVRIALRKSFELLTDLSTPPFSTMVMKCIGEDNMAKIDEHLSEIRTMIDDPYELTITYE